jgi:hypothetical protein
LLDINFVYFSKELLALLNFSIVGSGVVVHICNPSYVEGTDQEDLSSKPTQAKS